MSTKAKKKNVREIISKPEDVVFSDYTDALRIVAEHAKPTAGALRTAAPPDISPAAQQQLEIIEEVAVVIDEILTERHTIAAVRPFFDAFGESWGALHDGLLAKSRLAALAAVGEDAAKLHAMLFPEGIMFIRKDAHGAWSEGDRLLRMIDQRGMKAEIDRVMGEELYAACRKSTAALREALGLGKTAREIPSSTRLQQALLQFSRDVARYARILSGETDLDDPASVERFRKAVAQPIDTFRSRRSTTGDAPTEPAVPVTPITPAPPLTPVTPEPEPLG